MEVEAWEVVHLRARRADVHPVLAAVGSYPRWWPGVSVTAAGEGWWLTHRGPGRPWRRPHQVRWTITRLRPGLGVRVAVRGDVVGRAEWYYLDRRHGITVHYLVRGHVPDRGGRGLLEAHRRSVRAGLQALKARYERDRLPGDELDPGLVLDQRAAVQASRGRAQAHEARRARRARQEGGPQTGALSSTAVSRSAEGSG